MFFPESDPRYAVYRFTGKAAERPAADRVPAGAFFEAEDTGALYYRGDRAEWRRIDLSGGVFRRGNRAIIIGDSIAAGGDAFNASTFFVGGSWFSRLCSTSQQRLRMIRNAGIGGNSSSAMAARFATDVLAYRPDVVVIAAITPNDTTQGVSISTRKANVAAMVAAAQLDERQVILATSAPHDTPATVSELLAMNAWLAGYANANGLPLLDLYSPLADPADSTYASAYTSDGVHPTAGATRVLAEALSSRLPSWLTPTPVFGVSKSDPSNLVANGVFVGDTNSDGLADSWISYGGITAKSLSAISGGYGNWQQVTGNGSLGVVQSADITTGWAVGDRLAFSGRMEADANVSVSATITFQGGAPYNAARGVSAIEPGAVANQSWYIEVPVPPGTTLIYVTVSVNSAVGNVRIGQVTVRNLTELGL